jgi:hypothetical protein
MNDVAKPHNMQPCISEAERERRRNAVAFARGSVRYEGFVLSEKVEAINRQFIDGLMTGEEHVAAIINLS